MNLSPRSIGTGGLPSVYTTSSGNLRATLSAAGGTEASKKSELVAISPALLALYAAADLAEFWTALQGLLKESLPYDALVVYLNYLDFKTSWRAARILATPNAERPSTWFESRRKVDLSLQYVLSQPHRVKLFRLSDVRPPQGELRETAFFQNYFAPDDWQHVAVCLFWRGNTVRSEIAVRRTSGQGDFTDREFALLETLYPHIETVLNRILLLEEERAQRRWLAEYNHHLPFALMFLDWELQPLCANRRARELCFNWHSGTKSDRRHQARTLRIPDDITQACRQLKAASLQSRPDSAGPARLSQRITASTDSSLTATLSLFSDEHTPATPPGFAIYIEQSESPNEQTSRPSYLERLTPTERELAVFLRQGLSNKELATRFSKSVDTVKAQLSSIYRKCGVTSRARFLAMSQ